MRNMMWLVIAVIALSAAGMGWRMHKARQRRQRHAERQARRAEADRLWHETIEKNRKKSSGDT